LPRLHSNCGPGAFFGTVAPMSPSVLADSFDHHVWATLRLLEFCDALDAEQLAAAVPGTYGSIIDTLRHLVEADAGYLSLLTDGLISESDESTMDLAQLRAAVDGHPAAWKSLVSDTSDPDVDVVRYRDDGSTSHAPLGIRVAQALQHGTDHRSQ